MNRNLHGAAGICVSRNIDTTVPGPVPRTVAITRSPTPNRSYRWETAASTRSSRSPMAVAS